MCESPTVISTLRNVSVSVAAHQLGGCAPHGGVFNVVGGQGAAGGLLLPPSFVGVLLFGAHAAHAPGRGGRPVRDDTWSLVRRWNRPHSHKANHSRRLVTAVHQTR